MVGMYIYRRKSEGSIGRNGSAKYPSKKPNAGKRNQ